MQVLSARCAAQSLRRYKQGNKAVGDSISGAAPFESKIVPLLTFLSQSNIIKNDGTVYHRERSVFREEKEYY